MDDTASVSVHLTSEVHETGRRFPRDSLELPGTSVGHGSYCSSCSNSPGPHSPSASASAPLTSPPPSFPGRKKSSSESVGGTRVARGSADRRKSSGGGLSGGGGGGGRRTDDERHGLLHYAIPIMPLPLAAILCLLNIVAPGIGKWNNVTRFYTTDYRSSAPRPSIALKVQKHGLKHQSFHFISVISMFSNTEIGWGQP